MLISIIGGVDYNFLVIIISYYLLSNELDFKKIVFIHFFIEIVIFQLIVFNEYS